MSVNALSLGRPSEVVGFSAVLPENGLLKKLAILFERIVCDDLSIHFVAGESDGMRARSVREWNSAYHARARELRWLRDAGVLLPLADFAGEMGLSKNELDRIRTSSQADAAPLTYGGEEQEQAVTFMSAYERLVASRLQSYGVEVVSITPVKRFEDPLKHSRAGEDHSEVVEVLIGAMPSADLLASWKSILELRRDPMLALRRQDLWHLVREARADHLIGTERHRLDDVLDAYENLLRVHAVRASHSPLQFVTFVSGRFDPDATEGNSPQGPLITNRHRSELVWREHFQSGQTIACTFTDIQPLTDLQSEVPLLAMDFISMISFSDLGRRKPGTEELVALAREINIDAGRAFLGRLNSYMSLVHLSNDREKIVEVQRQLAMQVLSPERLGEVEARFSNQGLYDKWILLHRAQLLVAIKLITRHGRENGGNCLKTAGDRAVVGELAIAINSQYGPDLAELDQPLTDVLAHQAVEAEFQRPPADWRYGFVRTRMLVGPLLRDFSTRQKLIDRKVPPFERIITLLNGLNFRDFLDTTLHMLVQPDLTADKAIEAVEAGTSWYLDVAAFQQYVSGRSLKAWAGLMSVEPERIAEVTRGEENEASFFYDFTFARRYPLWQVDDHRYFAIDWFFLMERLSSMGAYWSIVNGLCDEELRSQFQFVWGEVIQEYVLDLVERCVVTGAGSAVRRPTYDDGSTEAFDSAMLIRDSLVAIEIKSSIMPAKHKYAGESAQFFQGLSAKFGSGKGAAVEQLLRNIGLLFAESDSRHVPSIRIDEINEVFPVAVVHEPLLCSGFASHALATEFREGLSQLKLVAGVQIHPLQVVALEDLERIEPYLTDREFTMADCFRAKIYEDPKHHWTFWDFMRLRYLPSRGIALRGNARLDTLFDWLMMAAMWRIYRGDYRDPSFGNIEPSERACLCVKPLDGDDVLFDEWKVLSEHETVAEAYRAYDEVRSGGVPLQQTNARTFELLVTDRFGIEAVRPT